MFCGSYLEDGVRKPYIDSDGRPFSTLKGYICPQNSKCLTVENPYSGTVSFDNFLQSLEMVFVIMSFNTFTDIMYDIVQTEYLAASLFFIVGSLALGLWLANLFIAVIVTSFKETREEEGKVETGDPARRARAAFAISNVHIVHLCRTKIGRGYYYCRELPLFFIFVDLVIQCTISSEATEKDIQSSYNYQLFLTSILGLEIVLRFVLYLPRVKLFFSSPMNCMDLTLAVATGIILIPHIYAQKILYAWLSIFQIARFYRVVIAIGFVRDLWARVVSDFRPIASLTVFYYLVTFLTSLLACVLLRGIIPMNGDDGVNFFAFQSLSNAFIGLYVVSTTENWTELMYIAIESADTNFSRACIAAFFIGWFILSNYVVLNIFIAIISENLDISPDGKRREQIKAFIVDLINERKDHNVFHDTRDLLAEKLGFKKKTKIFIANTLHMVERDKLGNFLKSLEDDTKEEEDDFKAPGSLFRDIIDLPFLPIKSFLAKRKQKQLDNPFHDSNEIKEYDSEQHVNNDDIVSGLIQAKKQLQESRLAYLKEHPRYNKSCNMFKPDNPLRVFCQSIVASSYGTRIEGKNPSPIVWYLFSMFMLLATIALVTIATIATPLYYQKMTMENSGLNGVIITDIVFVLLFTVEAGIKVIADGLYNTPNAFLRSVWGSIDSIVLISLWINMIQEMRNRTTAARLIRAFKALRALRLLSFSSKAQELFHNVLIVGVSKLFTATVVAVGLLFPFSVWGLNIFRGRLYECTDGDLEGSLTKCVGEFINVPFNWNVLSPRVVTSEYYDFNTFGHSFRILFEIISLEGWVDVLQSVMNIPPGGFSAPYYYADQFNAVFVMFYNLISTVFILTLFLSVIIQNYSVIRGSAFMTTDQKNWYELERTLKQIRPAKRPSDIVEGSFRWKVYQLVIEPSSWLSLASTANLWILVLFFCIDFYPSSISYQRGCEYASLFFTFVYLNFVFLKLYALGIGKFFRRRWDVFGFIVTSCAFGMGIVTSVFIDPRSFIVFNNVQKVFSAGMLILLIPRSRRLDQLVKTVEASASNVGNLLIVWAILYLAYGIAFNQVFGLTRIGPNGSTFVNFRTVPRSLVLLFRMSCGEGWNQIMSDYVVEYPYCYVSNNNSGSDCGSSVYGLFLFISWNVISMYIFANMFVSLIYENFSYVSRRADGKINRDEIRKFKNTWFEFDPSSTGYIPTSKLHDLLGKLDGYFSLRIHEGNWKVRSILVNSMAETANKYVVDIDALNKELRNYPVREHLEKRDIYERFCKHALLMADPVKGINFNQLLLQFPFYKDFKYSESLKLHDYIRYREIERRVIALVQQARYEGTILMVQSIVKYRNMKRLGVTNWGEWTTDSWKHHNDESTEVEAEFGSPDSANKLLPTITVQEMD